MDRCGSHSLCRFIEDDSEIMFWTQPHCHPPSFTVLPSEFVNEDTFKTNPLHLPTTPSDSLLYRTPNTSSCDSGPNTTPTPKLPWNSLNDLRLIPVGAYRFIPASEQFQTSVLVMLGELEYRDSVGRPFLVCKHLRSFHTAEGINS